jgi:hypothetical protein
LLSRYPDLVFIEFAVNDISANENRVMRSMEGIVRQIRRANPSVDIVFLYTLNKTSMAQIYDKGEKPPTVVWHERIAAHYGIPSLNIGEALWKEVHDGKATWEAMLPDNVHPSDRGYAIYAGQIRAFLEQHRKEKSKWTGHKLPRALTRDPFDDAKMVDTAVIAAEGWNRNDPTIRFPTSISSQNPGSELKYPFKGTAIGLFWLVAPDSGDIEWSIDGGAPKRASSWDKYALKFSRSNYVILADNLSSGDHVLKFKVLAEKNPESKGTWIRIGGILVNN